MADPLAPDPLAQLKSEYSEALRTYIRERAETSLFKGATIGRQAMAANMGVLDMVLMHHSCLADLIAATESAVSPSTIEAASQFFCETLSIFEITHRGFHEAMNSLVRVLEFASVVCHELRTPLTSIISSAGMLEEVLALDPAGAEGRLMANVLVSANILKRRTDELVDLVGLRSGVLSLAPKLTDMGRLIRGVADRLAPVLSQGKLRLVVEAPDELPAVVADPDRIDQVVSNLVQNSLKYAGEGSTVWVAARPSGKALLVEVRDDGAGIPEREQMRVFQPHFRGNQGGREVSGLGIGLALCKELVERHGGTICFHSEEGRGTVFTFELPLPQGSREGAEE